MKKGDGIASGSQTLSCCQSFQLKSIELTFLHFIKVFVRATRLCHLSKLKNDAVLVRFGLEVVCRVGSIGLISLVSIFDTIDVPIRLLRQLFLVLKQIGSYLIVCLIALLKIFSWQKTRSFCKTKMKEKK